MDVQGAASARSAEEMHAAKGATETGKPAFTITKGAASTEEISAAAITEKELARDDELGKLVSAAFNLPPPPMPSFE